MVHYMRTAKHMNILSKVLEEAGLSAFSSSLDLVFCTLAQESGVSESELRSLWWIGE